MGTFMEYYVIFIVKYNFCSFKKSLHSIIFVSILQFFKLQWVITYFRSFDQGKFIVMEQIRSHLTINRDCWTHITHIDRERFQTVYWWKLDKSKVLPVIEKRTRSSNFHSAKFKHNKKHVSTQANINSANWLWAQKNSSTEF